jgi:hypothetical protein
MTDSAQSDSWDDALRQAFTILLGRPLEEFPDAAYAAYYDCGDLAIELFQEGFDPGPLARGEIVYLPFPTIPQLGELLKGWDLITPHWSIDLARSIFTFNEVDAGRGIPELDSPILGRDLGRILTEHGLTPKDLSETFPDIQLRAPTAAPTTCSSLGPTWIGATTPLGRRSLQPSTIRCCEALCTTSAATNTLPAAKALTTWAQRTRTSVSLAKWSPHGNSVRDRPGRRWSSCRDQQYGRRLRLCFR